MVPSSVVIAVATLFWPKSQLSPLAANAIEATLNVNASVTERPAINTVALPTHMTSFTTLFIINALFSPFLYGGAEGRVVLCPHIR
jgi:hypothetical protein